MAIRQQDGRQSGRLQAVVSGARGQVQAQAPGGGEIQRVKPTGFQGIAGNVTGAAVIGQEIAEFEMQVWRGKGGGTDAGQQRAAFHATTDGRKSGPFWDDVPVEAVSGAAIRKVMGEDDDASFRIPAVGVGVGDLAAGDGEDRSADRAFAEAHIDADVQPTEAGAVAAEIIVAEVEGGQWVPQRIDGAAGGAGRNFLRRSFLRSGQPGGEEQAEEGEGGREAGHVGSEFSRKG